MVAHVPVRPLTKSHDFPHDDTKTPHITGWSKLSVRYCFWSRPANGDLSSLRMKNILSVKGKQDMELLKQIMQLIHIHLWRLNSLREMFLLTRTSPISTYTCGVRPLGIVLQHPWQTKVRDFTLQGVVNKDVPGGQVTVDVAHVRQVLHACSDATQHAHQLEGAKLSIMILTAKKHTNERLFQ